MRTYVINMRSEVDRRRSSREKFDALGLEFEFFDAIAGQAAFAAFATYDAEEFQLNTGRTITIGEVGCFASHRALWKRCVRLGEPILILEDDIDLLDDFPPAVHEAERLAPQLGFIRLQTDLRARRVPLFLAGRFTASRYTKAPHSTMCYAISPEAAQRFVAQTEVFDAPVDVFIKKFWEHGQPLHALTPYTVAPSVLSATTTIEGRVKAGRDLRLSAQRFLRKGRWYWQRWRFNLNQRLGRGRPVEILGNAHTSGTVGADTASKRFS